MCLPQNNVKLSSPWKVENTSKASFTYMKIEAFDTSQILVGRRKSVLARKSMQEPRCRCEYGTCLGTIATSGQSAHHEVSAALVCCDIRRCTVMTVLQFASKTSMQTAARHHHWQNHSELSLPVDESVHITARCEQQKQGSILYSLSCKNKARQSKCS